MRLLASLLCIGATHASSPQIVLDAIVKGPDSAAARDGEYVKVKTPITVDRGVSEMIVHAEGAPYLEMLFADVALGGGSLTVLSESREKKYGPYRAQDIRADGKLFIPMIAGERAIIRVTAGRDGPAPHLELDGVVQGYAKRSSSSRHLAEAPVISWPSATNNISCSHNARCYPEFADLMEATVQLHLGGSWCTGTLGSNDNGDVFVWTGKHCVNPASVNTFAAYVGHNLACEQWNPVAGIGTWGANAYQQYADTSTALTNMVILNDEQASDIIILGFPENPIHNKFVVLSELRTAPWSGEMLNVTSATGVCIHHPVAAPASIAQAIDVYTDDDQTRVNAMMLTGTTIGSSGSPLFVPMPPHGKYVMVGEMVGGLSSCTAGRGPNGAAAGGLDNFGSLAKGFANDIGFSLLLGQKSHEGTLYGCIDPTACNHNAGNVTHHKDFCRYVDACGVCGGANDCTTVYSTCGDVAHDFHESCCDLSAYEFEHDAKCQGLKSLYKHPANTCCGASAETLLSVDNNIISTSLVYKSPSPPPLSPTPSPPPLVLPDCVFPEPIAACNGANATYGPQVTEICCGLAADGLQMCRVTMMSSQPIPASDTYADRDILYSAFASSSGVRNGNWEVVSGPPGFDKSSYARTNGVEAITQTSTPWNFVAKFITQVIDELYFYPDKDNDLANDCLDDGTTVRYLLALPPAAPSPPVPPPAPPASPPPPSPAPPAGHTPFVLKTVLAADDFWSPNKWTLYCEASGKWTKAAEALATASSDVTVYTATTNTNCVLQFFNTPSFGSPSPLGWASSAMASDASYVSPRCDAGKDGYGNSKGCTEIPVADPYVEIYLPAADRTYRYTMNGPVDDPTSVSVYTLVLLHDAELLSPSPPAPPFAPPPPSSPPPLDCDLGVNIPYSIGLGEYYMDEVGFTIVCGNTTNLAVETGSVARGDTTAGVFSVLPGDVCTVEMTDSFGDGWDTSLVLGANTHCGFAGASFTILSNSKGGSCGDWSGRLCYYLTVSFEVPIVTTFDYQLGGGNWGEEMSFTLSCNTPEFVPITVQGEGTWMSILTTGKFTVVHYPTTICTLVLNDSYGDGWGSNNRLVLTAPGYALPEYTLAAGSTASHTFAFV